MHGQLDGVGQRREVAGGDLSPDVPLGHSVEPSVEETWRIHWKVASDVEERGGLLDCSVLSILEGATGAARLDVMLEQEARLEFAHQLRASSIPLAQTWPICE